MKKLLIAMMSVASLAFISKAEAINSGTTFENYGGAFGADKDDGGGNNGTFWYTAGSQSECGTLTNIDYTATYSGGRPAIAQGAATKTALAVEAEQRLERGIANYAPTDDGKPFAPQDIGSGIYFDTMVQFTATDIAPTPSQDDKLIVWLYGSADEDSAFGIGTNLMVTAGYLQAGDIPVASNYVVSVSGVTVEPNSWHRLTIKAIEKVADTVTAPCGFVVFIDGKEATNTEVKWSGESCLATPSAVAGVWAGKNALFPALVDYSSRQLSAVALEGTGMIDDISFTSVAPDFARDGNLFTLTWGAGLSALTLNGQPVADFSAGVEGSTVILVTTPGTTYTLSATPDSANGWAIASVTADGGVAYANNTFTVNGIGTGTIATKQACYTVNGAGAFETFAAALAEAIKSDRAKISLTADVTECISVADAEGKAIVLDLAGHDIAGITEGGADPAIIVSSGTLTIIDSVGGGVIRSNCDATVYCDGTGTLILGAAEGDKGLTVVGQVVIGGKATTFVRGKFSVNDNFATEIQAALAEGSSITTDDTYIIVTPGESPDPEPTTYALTIPKVTGATAAVTKDGVAVADHTKIAEGTTVVVTWTASEGYKITAGATETITMDGNKVATAPTVKAIQYATVMITQVEHCTITVKNGETVVVSGQQFDIDYKVDLTVTRTPAAGYVLDKCDVEQVLRLDEAKDYEITAAVKPVYPAYIPENATADTKKKFDDWVTNNAVSDRDTASANMEAFLLNVAPNADTVAAEKANFKVESITVVKADGTVTVTVTTNTKNGNGKPYNGTVKVKGKVNLTDAEWLPKDDTQHRFFKAFLEVE